jgi:hypothetical protein
MSTPKSPDTLAVLAAFQYSSTKEEAVADTFRALALLHGAKLIARDRLFRIADELDP